VGGRKVRKEGRGVKKECIIRKEEKKNMYIYIYIYIYIHIYIHIYLYIKEGKGNLSSLDRRGPVASISDVA
jgi:hypothetical protein